MSRLFVILLLTLPVGCGPVRTTRATADPASGTGGRNTEVAAPAAPEAPADVDSENEAPDASPVDFETQVRPILERCRPCHFEGGKMYKKLPFDRPETIRTLGERLFSRIRDAQEQRIILDFLAEGGADQDPALAGTSAD